ncbi:MAG: leucyl aminopeptidase [Acidimicrobiia bacterium]|nr:leucyl aminopeptidase [Acidimicrobiia bacterium]
MIEIAGSGPIADAEVEVVVVPVGTERQWGPGAEAVADAIGDWLTAHLDTEDFTGKAGQTVMVATAGSTPWKAALFVGLGDDPSSEDLRHAAGRVGRMVSAYVSVATTLHQLPNDGAAEAVASGFAMGQYRFDKYKTEPKPVKTERLLLADADAETVAEARNGLVVAAAVSLARDLVNEPPVAKSPEVLAGVAETIAADHDLRIKVYDEDEIVAERFGGLAAVAAGAAKPARMVEMWYEPEGATAFLALVGKGIVFDSGGLSLKPANMMEDMKTDMSGGAAVLAAMQAIATLGLKVRVLAVVPFTENMPGGAAQRPGDVLTARNGKTIEVLNTDAEGRLVLADGLSLAVEHEPDLVVDLATLTGACKIALGEEIAGLFANTEEASDQVLGAAAKSGERLWRLPLPDDYRKKIDSDVADMKNTGPRWGGAISAAHLLKEFVNDRPWAHLDIAGPARATSDEGYIAKGGTGYGVRTLVALAESMATH